jgi:CO/xanthine dehydrogenase Mo-binding subunit
MPVASDVPMIDAILVEVANAKHLYGVRGVGETPIVPPLGAIANAMENATGIRFTELPLSPPKGLGALREKDALFEPIGAESEVFLLPQIAGGVTTTI